MKYHHFTKYLHVEVSARNVEVSTYNFEVSTCNVYVLTCNVDVSTCNVEESANYEDYPHKTFKAFQSLSQ